jgi:hypothetical protein
MSPAFRRTLPARPDLEQQKKLARELLRAFRDNKKDAVARLRAELPDKAHVTLADAQFVLAREYGFTNWAELSQHIAQRSIDALPPIDRFRKAVRDRDPKWLRRVLADHADVRARIDEPLFSFDSPALLSVVGDLELVDVLLAFGADPNRRSSWWAGGFHALHSARGAVAERLIAAGSVPDVPPPISTARNCWSGCSPRILCVCTSVAATDRRRCTSPAPGRSRTSCSTPVPIPMPATSITVPHPPSGCSAMA